MKTYFVNFIDGTREAFQADGIRIERNVIYLWKRASSSAMGEPVALISAFNMNYTTVAEPEGK